MLKVEDVELKQEFVDAVMSLKKNPTVIRFLALEEP